MKKKPLFPYMYFILSIFSAFVGAYLAWYFRGESKSLLDFLIFFVVFSFGFALSSIHLTKRKKKIITDERIDKILDKSARNSFIVVCFGLVALSIIGPKPFNLLSLLILAIGISAYMISSIVYHKRGDIE